MQTRSREAAEIAPGRLTKQVADWLVDAVAPGRSLRAWQPGELVPPDLLPAAVVHGVEGWVRQRARSTGHTVPGVDEAVHAALALHRRTMEELRFAAAALNGAGVPFLVVKGPALVELYYDGPAERCYVDLDLLVEPASVGDALNALTTAGATLLDVNWPLLQREDVHELALLGASGGAIDLHWSLGSGRFSRDSSPAFAALHAASRELVLEGISIRTLGALDTAIHVAAHAAASGGHRLIWLADLRASLVGLGGQERGELRHRVQQWRVAPSFHLMARRLERVLGDVDGVVRDAVDRRDAWWYLGEIAERVSPPERTGSGGSVARFVARSCRESSATSAVEFVRKTWMTTGMTRRGSHCGHALHDPSCRNSSRYRQGSAQPFLAAIAERETRRPSGLRV